MTPESQETPHPARTFHGTLARDMHDCLRPTTRGYHPLAGRQAPAGSRCDATYWRQSHGRGRRAPLTPEPDRRGTSTASRARRPPRASPARVPVQHDRVECAEHHIDSAPRERARPGRSARVKAFRAARAAPAAARSRPPFAATCRHPRPGMAEDEAAPLRASEGATRSRG